MPHYAEFESDTTTSELTPIKHAAENWKQTKEQTLTADFWIETFGVLPSILFLIQYFVFWCTNLELRPNAAEMKRKEEE